MGETLFINEAVWNNLSSNFSKFLNRVQVPYKNNERLESKLQAFMDEYSELMDSMFPGIEYEESTSKEKVLVDNEVILNSLHELMLRINQAQVIKEEAAERAAKAKEAEAKAKKPAAPAPAKRASGATSFVSPSFNDELIALWTSALLDDTQSGDIEVDTEQSHLSLAQLQKQELLKKRAQKALNPIDITDLNLEIAA